MRDGNAEQAAEAPGVAVGVRTYIVFLFRQDPVQQLLWAEGPLWLCKLGDAEGLEGFEIPKEGLHHCLVVG